MVSKDSQTSVPVGQLEKLESKWVRLLWRGRVVTRISGDQRSSTECAHHLLMLKVLKRSKGQKKRALQVSKITSEILGSSYNLEAF
jgi:hypothetical protein